MLIVGAKGFAKELLEILHQNGDTENLCFYDDVTPDIPDFLFDKFPIIKNLDDAKNYFNNVDSRFSIGIGNPSLRKKMFEQFSQLGGECSTILSKKADVGSFDNKIENGCIITSGVIVTNSVWIKKGSMINISSTVGHDTTIGEYVEICPNVSISGHCEIGNCTFIGTSATILPGVSIGANSVIAAGSVVRTDIPENVMAAGIPAIIKKQL